MDTSEQYKESIVSPLEPLEKIEHVKWYEDPVYKKMCDCEEIQKSHKWELGSFYWMPKDGDCAIYSSECREFSRFTTLSDGQEFALDDPFIWLPAQSQLQEMVQGEKHSHLLAHEFALWCHGGEELGRTVYGFPNCTWSMEQLWLAFVMKEKFDKTWDGDKWV